MIITYIGIYCLVGLLVLALRAWLAHRRPTFWDTAEKMDKCAERGVDEYMYPDGVPFRLLAARRIATGLAMIVGILGWPAVVVALISRQLG